MYLVAIRQEKSGQNTDFITNDFKKYTLSDILSGAVPLSGVQLIEPKTQSPYIRSIPNIDINDNLDQIAITCNDGDYLLFDRRFLYLKALNGRAKKQWPAFSGNVNATINDQDTKDFGPLPEGEYIVHFKQSIDFKNNLGLIDALNWVRKSPAWGLVATPIEQIKGDAYNRGDFYIHGGLFKGTAGCIELNGFLNGSFHSFLKLYDRSFKLIVNYTDD